MPSSSGLVREEGRAGTGGFWPEDDATEKEFSASEGREAADKCWGEAGRGPGPKGSAPGVLAAAAGWLGKTQTWRRQAGAGRDRKRPQLQADLAASPKKEPAEEHTSWGMLLRLMGIGTTGGRWHSSPKP